LNLFSKRGASIDWTFELLTSTIKYKSSWKKSVLKDHFLVIAMPPKAKGRKGKRGGDDSDDDPLAEQLGMFLG
jgi:hypothetical protein